MAKRKRDMRGTSMNRNNSAVIENPPDDDTDDLERNQCQWCRYGPERCDRERIETHTEYGQRYSDCVAWEDEEEEL